jgi:hypothetical protein
MIGGQFADAVHLRKQARGFTTPCLGVDEKAILVELQGEVAPAGGGITKLGLFHGFGLQVALIKFRAIKSKILISI